MKKKPTNLYRKRYERKGEKPNKNNNSVKKSKIEKLKRELRLHNNIIPVQFIWEKCWSFGMVGILFIAKTIGKLMCKWNEKWLKSKIQFENVILIKWLCICAFVNEWMNYLL